MITYTEFLQKALKAGTANKDAIKKNHTAATSPEPTTDSANTTNTPTPEPTIKPATDQSTDDLQSTISDYFGSPILSFVPETPTKSPNNNQNDDILFELDMPPLEVPETPPK
eukprot:CAMPEP_0114696670 /NCGR_PEP_ID=MMETSP0191-20121206/72846_1 /TAXON_ID=126664 /ORGANISM="Sorites sp." /LENGTH=111 /DNA_ID=CAMNT_0001994657 /DNA_START=35 /DNA_END=370 /DNA_ORIENTATION=+